MRSYGSSKPPRIPVVLHGPYTDLGYIIHHAFGRSLSEADRAICEGAVFIDDVRVWNRRVANHRIHGKVLRMGLRSEVRVELVGYVPPRPAPKRPRITAEDEHRLVRVTRENVDDLLAARRDPLVVLSLTPDGRGGHDLTVSRVTAPERDERGDYV